MTLEKYGGRDQTVAANTNRISMLVDRAAADMDAVNSADITGKIPLSDLERIKQRATIYLRDCATDGTLPTVRGMAAKVGVSRNAFYSYSKDHPDSEFSKWLEDFSDLCGELTMAAALDGSVNVVAAIFTAKARYAWKDTFTVENVPPVVLEPSLTPEEIAEKWRNLIGDD